jgi:hypothetical protein
VRARRGGKGKKEERQAVDCVERRMGWDPEEKRRGRQRREEKVERARQRRR